DDDFFDAPLGVAHFLEHKMFEDEDGDAFERFAKTGANANAFTTFDKTCYLFSGTDKIYDSLEILLDFVTTPYFTKEGTDKEKGIIAQEINMYKDNADWCVFFNLLQGLYHNHPVRIDIAGTVDSINTITKDTLYKCYNTFYNLNNMVLSVAGNFNEDKVIKICDKILKPAKSMSVINDVVDEPLGVFKKEVVQELPVSIPIFDIGFKEKPFIKTEKAKKLIYLDIILEYIAGDTSELYQQMYDRSLINSAFGYEIFSGFDYLSIIFGGESSDPRKVYNLILDAIKSVKETGLDRENFDIVKKAIYGNKIRAFESPNNICSSMVNSHFEDKNLFESINALNEISFDECNDVLQSILDADKSCISIVKGR
ncbi:MAG: EF-P 5-aminopentanol modification-associated protein YfmH, partial [Oscillospiraceae bacterium]